MSELWHTIEPWAETWGANLWRASWQGGLVILAAWAITRWCKFLSPRVTCWIWRLACVKLLVGLVSIQPLTIPILPGGSPSTVTAGNETREMMATQTEFAAPRASFEPQPALANSKPQVGRTAYWDWLLTLWLVGVGYRVSLTARQWKSVRRLCRSAAPAQNSGLQDACRREADRLEIRRLPRIRFSPHADVPLLAGVWRPMILLPAGALEIFDDGEVRLMLGHELAHLKRRDLLWNWLPTVVSWLFFFHPLVWLLPRRWSEAQEAACDELLIQSNSAGVAAYGRLLVKIAAHWPREQRPALMAAGVLGTYRNLERRILAMARVKPISHRRLLVAAGTASLVAALGIIPWRLVAQEPKAEQNAPTQGAGGEINKNGHGLWLGASIKSPTPQIIIAEHVLLWDNEIVTWEQVVKRLRAKRAAGPFRAVFMTTNGLSNKKDGGWQFWHDRIMAVYAELFEPVGVTFGSLSPRGGEKFDAVRRPDDLSPDPAHARAGRLLTPDGKPAADAHVLILPCKAVMPVMLKGIELRDSLDEQWALSDETGGFKVYPDEDDYLIAALHPTGFVCQRGPAKGTDMTLRLQPWAVVTLASTGEIAGQWAGISVCPKGAGPEWPQFSIYELKTTGKPIDVKVPAGQIVVDRNLVMKEGTSIGAPVDTFSLGPGERRTSTIAQASAEERAAATETFEETRKATAAQGKTDAAPQPAANPSSKDKPAAERAPEADKKPLPAARVEQGSQILRDKQKKTAPILAAMAKEHGYGLDNDQDVRRVPPPFPAIRMEWYRMQTPNPAIPEGPSSIVFQWSKNRLGNWRGVFGGSASEGSTILGLLDAAGIKKQLIDGPSEILYKRLPGDWVIRSGASDEQVVKELAAILHDELSLSISMAFSEVERPVYIVDGSYQHKPMPGGRDKIGMSSADETRMTDVIEVFSTQLIPDSDGRIGTFADFLASLGHWIDTPIVSEVPMPPQGDLTWYLHERSPFTAEMQAEDHDAKLVLANITAQTGLSFR